MFFLPGNSNVAVLYTSDLIVAVSSKDPLGGAKFQARYNISVGCIRDVVALGDFAMGTKPSLFEALQVKEGNLQKGSGTEIFRLQ